MAPKNTNKKSNNNQSTTKQSDTCESIDPENKQYWINGSSVNLGCLGFYPTKMKHQQAKDHCAQFNAHLGPNHLLL